MGKVIQDFTSIQVEDWLHEDNFIARFNKGHDGAQQTLSCTSRDRNLGIRVEVPTMLGGICLGQRFFEYGIPCTKIQPVHSHMLGCLALLYRDGAVLVVFNLLESLLVGINQGFGRVIFSIQTSQLESVDVEVRAHLHMKPVPRFDTGWTVDDAAASPDHCLMESTFS